MIDLIVISEALFISIVNFRAKLILTLFDFLIAQYAVLVYHTSGGHFWNEIRQLNDHM